MKRFLLMSSRRFSRICLPATLTVVALGQDALSQCASGLFPNWTLCGSGTTITEGTQATITLWIARGTGVAGQSAEFSITVSSTIAGNDPLNTSTVTIGRLQTAQAPAPPSTFLLLTTAFTPAGEITR